MGQVIAVCGMPASGKGEFASFLATKGIPVRSMGDMVRAEVASLGIEEGPNVFGEVATALRAEHGDDILAIRLTSAVDSLLEEHPIVLIEGMRGTAEKAVFVEHWGPSFISVAIIADTEIRFQRVISRGRSEDGDRSTFRLRDERENGWGLEQIISEADFTFSNNQDVSELTLLVSDWLTSL